MEPMELSEPTTGDDPIDGDPEGDLTVEELLIEEISIDGMCGVY